MPQRTLQSATSWLGSLGLCLACLVSTGCHSYLGSHQPAVFTPSESRDETIRKKAASDPFTPAGQTVPDLAQDSANFHPAKSR